MHSRASFSSEPDRVGSRAWLRACSAWSDADAAPCSVSWYYDFSYEALLADIAETAHNER